MMGNEDGMIFTPMVGNYTRDDPTSFTGKITWDLIGDITWDETTLLAARQWPYLSVGTMLFNWEPVQG
jgi:hypothetical protein